MESTEDEFREYCIKHGFSDRVLKGGPEYLIRKWEGAAKAIERGTFVDYEFLMWMGTRQVLHELIPAMTEAQWSSISDRVDKTDGRVKELTVPSDKCIKRSGASGNELLKHEVHWWYFRVPKKLPVVWKL